MAAVAPVRTLWKVHELVGCSHYVRTLYILLAEGVKYKPKRPQALKLVLFAGQRASISKTLASVLTLLIVYLLPQ